MPFVELIIVLFVILAVITRFLTLYLLRKYRKLREDFDNARRAQSSEAANLRREIAELKKQIPSVLALPPAPTVPGEKPLERLTPLAPAPAKEVSVLPSRVELPAPAAQPPQKAPMPPACPAPRVPEPALPAAARTPADVKPAGVLAAAGNAGSGTRGDRKSTRLNSSHQIISYAVFC